MKLLKISNQSLIKKKLIYRIVQRKKDSLIRSFELRSVNWGECKKIAEFKFSVVCSQLL